MPAPIEWEVCEGSAIRCKCGGRNLGRVTPNGSVSITPRGGAEILIVRGSAFRLTCPQCGAEHLFRPPPDKNDRVAWIRAATT